MSSTFLLVVVIVLSVLLFLGIILLVVFETEYSHLINNESALCLTGSCEESSSKCGTIPFQYDSSGNVVCAPPNIFNVPDTNVSQ